MPDQIETPAAPANAAPAAGAAVPPATPPAGAGAPPAAAKPDDKGTPPAAKVVPETYDLKLPDGSPLDPATIEKTAAYAKERGLSNEEAQALIDRENETISSYVEKQHKELEEKTVQWEKTWEGDKEIGGGDFKKNAELAKRVVERFGSPELKKALNDTGLGNHPELGRLLVRIGKAMTDDQLVLPGAMPAAKKTPAQVLYGPDQNQ